MVELPQAARETGCDGLAGACDLTVAVKPGVFFDELSGTK
jgi:hypothetical protein